MADFTLESGVEVDLSKVSDLSDEEYEGLVWRIKSEDRDQASRLEQVEEARNKKHGRAKKATEDADGE